MIRVLFVCTGNTCRSPMAEALLREKIRGKDVPESVSVSSTGISAWEGQTASPEAVCEMVRRGIPSIAAHRSRQVNASHISESDLVLAMTWSHKQSLQKHFSDHAGKIFMLSEYAGATGDVADPIGGTRIEYEKCADELDRLTEAVLRKIFTTAGKKGQNGEKEPDVRGR